MIYMCGSGFPTYPNSFHPTLNIKMVFGEKKQLKVTTFSDFEAVFCFKCFDLN